MNMNEIEVWSTEPRVAAPADVCGGFGVSAAVYTVDTDGRLYIQTAADV